MNREEITLRVLDIVDGTIVDGPGLRTSIYLAGCSHECPGCHNPQSWDFAGGMVMSVGDLIEHIRHEGLNVTLTGGDPLFQIEGVEALCQAIKEEGYSVWVYTGFTYEQVYNHPSLCRILHVADVMVDGPFKLNLRDLSLRFRGSSNQRIIDLAKSIGPAPVLWE